MTTGDMIAAGALVVGILGIQGLIFGYISKLYSSVEVLKASVKKHDGFVSRVATLEANAENHAEMIKEHKQESKDFRRALEQNTLAISELTTLIKHKL